MIRNLVFDIGNVLADFKWRDYLDSYHFPPEVHKIVEKALFLNPLWKEVDRGEMPDEAILEAMCKDVPSHKKVICEVYEKAAQAVHQNWYAPGLLKQLKGMGYSIYILSNYGKTFFEQRLNQFDFFRYADGQVISYEIQAIKPEPEIYRELLRRYGLKLEETLFFDDLPENLRGAETFGISTVQVTGYESIVEGLKKFGIEIDPLD